MVTRVLFALLIAWTAATTVAAEPKPTSGSLSPPGPKPDQPGAMARDTADKQPSGEDDDVIKNLDLIEHLDLLDAVEALGAVNAADTPEEEF